MVGMTKSDHSLSVGQGPWASAKATYRMEADASPNPAVGLRNYYDFIRYTQATQGHLNSQGLCYIARQYPAPPGGS